MAYLDDIHTTTESLRGLEAVAEVTTDFANATDGGVNAGKSFFYATNADAPGTLTVQSNRVLRKTSFDVLGTICTVGKGAPPASQRFEAAKNIARRARNLPIPMDQKEGYVAASATAKALYGVSVRQPAGTWKACELRPRRGCGPAATTSSTSCGRLGGRCATRRWSRRGIEDGINGGATRDLLEKGLHHRLCSEL
ncbi:hypothetical protein DIPPA_06674 [Diplonema papillatum]|nr:hypothetical protein DIPPA_06674 [Diplonema papillatum]